MMDRYEMFPKYDTRLDSLEVECDLYVTGETGERVINSVPSRELGIALGKLCISDKSIGYVKMVQVEPKENK